MRVSGWATRLADCFNNAMRKPFVWGKNDCVTFTANAIRDITATDPIADLREQWSTEEEAEAKINELGGLREAVSARLGAPLENAMFAGCGDVVLTDSGCLAVVALTYALAPTKLGLMRFEPNRWSVGWRVG